MNTTLTNCVITEEDLKYAVPLISKLAQGKSANETIKAVYDMISQKGTLVKALSVAALVPDVLISLNINTDEAKQLNDNIYKKGNNQLDKSSTVDLYEIMANTANIVGVRDISKLNPIDYTVSKRSRKVKDNLKSPGVYGRKVNGKYEIYYYNAKDDKLKYYPSWDSNIAEANIEHQEDLSKITLKDGIYKVFEYKRGKQGFTAVSLVTVKDGEITNIRKQSGNANINNTTRYEYTYKLINQPGGNILYAPDGDSEFNVVPTDSVVVESDVSGKFTVDGVNNVECDGAVVSILSNGSVLIYAHRKGDPEIKPRDNFDAGWKNGYPIAFAVVKPGDDIYDEVEKFLKHTDLDFVSENINEIESNLLPYKGKHVFDVMHNTNGLKSAKKIDEINDSKPDKPKKSKGAATPSKQKVSNKAKENTVKANEDKSQNPPIDKEVEKTANDLGMPSDFNNDDPFAQTRSLNMEHIHDVTEEQDKEAMDWFNNHSFKELFKLRDFRDRVSQRGPNIVATWTNEAITLYKGSDNTSIYHEAFHGMFWMFLNPKQRKELYDELRSNNGEFINMDGKTVSYKDASELELEEAMAEGFRDYMLTGKTQFELKAKTRKWYDVIIEFLKGLFDIDSTYSDTKSKIQSIYDDIKSDNLDSYQSNFDKDNGKNILREQTILQKDSYININKLDKYKIGNKSLLKYAEEYLVEDVRSYKGYENFELDSDKQKRFNQLAFGWPKIRSRIANLIASTKFSEDDNFKLQRITGKKAVDVTDIEPTDMDSSANGVVSTKSGVGLNEQRSKDVNDMMVSLYVSFMRSNVLPQKGLTGTTGPQMSLSSFIDYMSTNNGKTEFFEYAKSKIEKMVADKGSNEDIVLNFVKANFGDTSNIQNNLSSDGGKVYGVIGYFIKNNPKLFMRSVRYDEVFDEGSSGEAGSYVHALMEWDRSGNESRLADLLKNEISLLVSTIPLYTPVLDENGFYTIEKGAVKYGYSKNKFRELYSGNDESVSEFMNNLQNPRVVMNKIQEIVKNSPDFKTFVRKIYEASGLGAKKYKHTTTDNNFEYTLVDHDIQEVVKMLGGLSKTELKNSRFDSVEKQDLWTAFYVSFCNTSEKGKLIRMTIDFTGYEREHGRYKSSFSLIDGSAASRDAVNVLNKQFKADLYHNALHDIFDPKENTLDGRIRAFAKSIENLSSISTGIKNGAGEVVLTRNFKSLTNTNTNLALIPKDVRDKLGTNDVVCRIQVGDHNINKERNASVSDYIFFSIDKGKVKYYNEGNPVRCINTLENDVQTSAEIFEDDFDSELTLPSFVASYFNNGVSMQTDTDGNFVDLKAVLGMLMLNVNTGNMMYNGGQIYNFGFNIIQFEKSRDVIGADDFTMNKDKYLGFSLGTSTKFSDQQVYDENGNMAGNSIDLNYVRRMNRLYLLRTIGLFMHQTPQFSQFLDSFEPDNRLNSLLKTIVERVLSGESKEYSITDVFPNGSQQWYMLNELMNIEARFLNSTASYSQRTGDNNMSFENSLNSTLSVMVDELNRAVEEGSDEKARVAKLKDNEKLSYLNPDKNPMARRSKIFSMMFGIGNKKEFDETDIDIPEDGLKIEIARVSGIEIYGNGAHLAGSNAYQADRKSRYLNDILLATKGIFSPIQHSDKKSTYAVVVNHNFNKIDNYRRSNLYIDLYDSVNMFNGNETIYEKFTNYMLDYTLGEIEYAEAMYDKYKKGTLGKADYKTLSKIVDLESGAIKYDHLVLYDRLAKGKSQGEKTQIQRWIKGAIDKKDNSSKINLISAVKNSFEDKVSEVMREVGEFSIPTNTKNSIMGMYESIQWQNNNIEYDDDYGYGSYNQEDDEVEKNASKFDDNAIRIILARNYVLNSYIHGIELSILFYGNLSQFNPNDFTKRVGGFGSTGSVVNTSQYATNLFEGEVVTVDDEGNEVLLDTPITYTHKMMREVYPELFDADGNPIDEAKLINKLKSSLHWGETMKTMVCTDLKVKSVYVDYYKEHIGSDADGYGETKKYDEADAFAIITFDKYRQYLISEKKWPPEHEKMYNDIINGRDINIRTATKVFMPIKAQYIGPLESNMNNMAFHKYQLFPIIPTMYKPGSLMDNIHKRMMHEGISYMTFKTGSKLADITDRDGNIQNVIDVNADGDKSINKDLGSKYANTSMLKKYKKDFTVFKSDLEEIKSKEYVIGNNGIISKIGDKYYFSTIDDGNFESINECAVDENGNLFDSDGDMIVLDDYTNNIYTAYLKDQLVIHDEYEGSIVNPSQMRKIMGTKIWNGGVPNDIISKQGWNELSVEKRRSKWDSLSESEKEALSPLYKKFTNFVNALSNLRDYKKNALLKKLGALDKNGNLKTFTDDNGNEHVQFDTKKVADFIIGVIDREGLDEGFKDIIDYDIDDEGNIKFKFDIRSSLSGGELEKKIVTLLDKEVTQFRVYGETLIQAPNTFFGEKVNFRQYEANDEYDFGTNGLSFYKVETIDEHTQVVSMKVKVPMLGKFKLLLDLPDLEGNTDREKLDSLNKKLKDKEWFAKHKDMLTMISVRIPTQGFNSIEMMEVWEFLPPEAPNCIILPSEIVVKSGGDYDIDKMPIMMPHIHKIYKDDDLDISADTKDTDKDIVIDSLKNISYNIRNGVKDVLAQIVDAKTDGALTQMISVSKGLLDYKEVYKVVKGELRTQYLSDVAESVSDKFNEIDTLYRKIVSNGDLIADNRYSDIRMYASLLYNIAKCNKAIFDYDKRFSEELGKWVKSHKGQKITDDVKNKIAESIKDTVEINGKALSISYIRNKRSEEIAKLSNFVKSLSTKLLNGEFSTVGVSESKVTKLVNWAIDLRHNVDLLNNIDENILENEYRNSIINIMSDASIFPSLISPNSISDYKDVKKELSDGKNKTISDLVDPVTNQKEREAFVAGKEALGMGAVDNVQTPIFNQIGLTTTQNVIGDDGNQIKGALIKLPFEYNSVDGGGIDLSLMYDASYNGSNDLMHDIQNKINQIINGFVDVAKDPWVKNIGADKTRTPALLFMLQAGVSIEDAVYLCVNPLVSDFCVNIETRKGSLNAISVDTSTNKKDLLNAVANHNDASVLLQDDLKIKVGDSWVPFSFDRQSIALLLNEFTFSKSIKSIYNDKGADETKYSGINIQYKDGDGVVHNNGHLTYNEIAALEFLQIKYMADDLTDVKLKISQDTKVNKTATDIDQSADFSGLKYFDIDEKLIDKLHKTPVGIFNDKAFISDMVNSLRNPLNQTYNNIHSFVIKNKHLLNDYSDLTVGEVEMELVSIANMMIYQRELRNFNISDAKKAEYIDGYRNHIYPANVRINSLEEYAMYRVKLETLKDDDIDEFFFEKARLLTSDEDKARDIARSYYALHQCFNHDAIFTGAFSFAKRFQYYASNYPKLPLNFQIFNMIKKSDDTAIDLLTIDAQDEDIPMLKENLREIKDPKILKSYGIDETTAKHIASLANYFETFAMLQSDGSVEGKFGISKLGNDVERMEMIKNSDIVLTGEEVFINWYKNRSANVGKFIDGDIRIISKNGSTFVEIDGLLYSEYDSEKSGVYSCDNVIAILSGTLNFFDKPVELGGTTMSRLTSIQQSLSNYLVADRAVYDSLDLKYKGSPDYRISTEERTIINDMFGTDDIRDGVVVVRKQKCESEAMVRNGINASAKFSESPNQLDFSNPFDSYQVREYIKNGVMRKVFGEDTDEVYDQCYADMYDQWLNGANKIVINYNNNDVVVCDMDDNSKEYSILLKRKRDVLHQALKSGLIFGKQVVCDKYNLDSAKVLKKYIDNPQLANSTANTQIVTVKDKNGNDNEIHFEIDQSSNREVVRTNVKALSNYNISLTDLNATLIGENKIVSVDVPANFDAAKSQSELDKLADKLIDKKTSIRIYCGSAAEYDFVVEMARRGVNVVVRTTRNMIHKDENDKNVYNNEISFKQDFIHDYNGVKVGEITREKIIEPVDVKSIISNGKIDFDKLKEITTEYFKRVDFSRFNRGRKDLTTRVENHQAKEYTIDHLKNTVSAASNFKVSNDTKEILMLAAALHDIAKPFHGGLLHGEQGVDVAEDIFGKSLDPILKFAIKNHMLVRVEGKKFSMDDANRIINEIKDSGLDVMKSIQVLMALNYADIVGTNSDVEMQTIYEIVSKTNMLLSAASDKSVDIKSGYVAYSTVNGNSIIYGNKYVKGSDGTMFNPNDYATKKEMQEALKNLYNTGAKIDLFRDTTNKTKQSSEMFLAAVDQLMTLEGANVKEIKLSLQGVTDSDVNDNINNC